MIGILTAAKPPERAHERRLQNVVGIHAGAEHAHGEPSARILMSADQTAKRIDIAVEDGSYQFRVRRACHK